MHDKIILKGMRFYGYHGVLPQERAQGQPFVVDLIMFVDAANRGDELQHTIDYGLAFQLVRRIVEGEPCQLLETLASRLATNLLAKLPAAGVCLTVKKPQVPLDGELAYAAVEVERWRK